MLQNGTEEWLKKNGIAYDKLILDAQDKAKVCKEYEIDLFIDDSIKHCKKIESVGIKTFLYTSMMNEAVEVKELTRVYSWIQIYHKIQKILNKKLY